MEFIYGKMSWSHVLYGLVYRGAKLLIFFPQSKYEDIRTYFGIKPDIKRWLTNFTTESLESSLDYPVPHWALLVPGSTCLIGPNVFHLAINLQVLIIDKDTRHTKFECF